MRNQHLIHTLDLDLALKRVRGNIMRGSFPNRLDSKLIQHLGDQIKHRVEELFQDETLDWANGSARLFDMPRGDKLVRPICYLDVDIRVAFQALVDAVAKVIEPYIEFVS